MMLRLICLCCAFVSATTAFGQETYLEKTKVTGGHIVKTFVPDVPDGQQIAPMVDPAFPQPVFQQPVYQGQVVVQPQVHQHQHASNCGCPVCARRVLSQQTRERSKTIREITTVVVVEETHPARIINTPVSQPRMMPNPCPQPCPPRDPCAHPQQYPSGGLAPWDRGFQGYRPQQQRGPVQQGYGGQYAQNYRQPTGFNFFGLTVGFNGNAHAGAGYGHVPYQSSGYGQPWYGGR
jgi:hypothetical protein